MTERIFRCRDTSNMRQAFVFAWGAAKQFADPFEIVLRPLKASKSREQEELYHRLIGEIADTRTLFGKKLNKESWKRLLIDAFKYDTRQELADEWAKFGTVEMLPALNHPGFVIVGEQSRKFGVKLAGAFIDWLEAFKATEEKDIAA